MRPTCLGVPRWAPWGSYVLRTRPGLTALVPTQQRRWWHPCQPKLAVVAYPTCSTRFGAPKWAAWDCYVLQGRPVLFRHGRARSDACGIGPWPVGPCGPLGGLVTARGARTGTPLGVVVGMYRAGTAHVGWTRRDAAPAMPFARVDVAGGGDVARRADNMGLARERER